MKRIVSLILVIAMVTSSALLLSGCSIFGKDSLMATVKFPDLNKETQCVNAVSTLAVQAHIDAMLKEAKFYRLCEDNASAAEIQAALSESAKAWETADVLSSATYLMAKRLARVERTTDYSNLAAPSESVNPSKLFNPFVITAYADTLYRMEKFEDAKEWAEYINRIYDHASVGQKTAYVAKILKTDVNRAKLAVQMANDILKGKEDLNAGYDDATVKLLLKTKTAGKVAGFAAASIASAGTTMGALGFAGYLAGGVDAGLELTDTTLQITLGEDHVFTKAFQETTGKVAPIISVISFANFYNPEAWGSGVDAVGQFRFLTDSAVDFAYSGKILGIEAPTAGADMLKVVAIPKDAAVTDKEKEQLKETLTEMGFGEKAIERLMNPKEAEEAPADEKPFEELTVEEIDQKIEDFSISDEAWEALFNEIYNDYLEEMHDNGYLDDDDGIWDYDPFMPFEDFPQDGDEIGFDDLSMWATPLKPFEDDAATTEAATGTAEPEKAEEPEQSSGKSLAIESICGTYVNSGGSGYRTVNEEWKEVWKDVPADAYITVFEAGDGCIDITVSVTGKNAPQPIPYDPSTGTATLSYLPEGIKEPFDYKLSFEEIGPDKYTMHIVTNWGEDLWLDFNGEKAP